MSEMAFRESEDEPVHGIWKDIVLPDGTQLEFCENSGITCNFPEGSKISNFNVNWHQMNLAFIRRGILETNEIPAYNVCGEIMTEDIPLYIDKRIGKDKATELQGFVFNACKELIFGNPRQMSHPESMVQLEAAITTGIEVLGLTGLIGEHKPDEVTKSVGKTALDAEPKYDTGL